MDKDLETLKEALPDFKQVQQRFTALKADTKPEDKVAALKALKEAIEKNAQAPFYERLCEELHETPDPEFLGKLKARNEEAEKKLEEMKKDAEENLGENEVREAYVARAIHLARIGSSPEVVQAACDEAEKHTVASGQKMDLCFLTIRVALFFNDMKIAQVATDKAKALLEKGADWDRKNRLKVYEGVQALRRRDFKYATENFLDTVSTYSSDELFGHCEFVALTTAVALPVLERGKLNSKLLAAPEFTTLSTPGAPEISCIGKVATDLYSCDYLPFFPALVKAIDILREHWLLSEHADYVCRELRIRAYSQMLESYRSLQLKAMAKAFGVSEEFMDRELARFVSLGRLHCKIDRVSGVVETTRPDSRNKQYQDTIRTGDQLINRLQKLSRLVVF